MEETDLPASTHDLLTGHYAIMVLLVDDQPMIGEAVRRALASESDISFHYCSDPLQALQTAKKIRPTVILQDLVMPGVDGLLLVGQYRGDPATQHIPIIVLSTKEEAAIKSAAFATGANDYLVKLPDYVELVARIRYHSRAYLNLLQRDAAFKALHRSQRELVEKNVELSRLINVDGLTGLNNRRYFDEVAGIQWRCAIRDHAEFALLMIDVDDFKRYNDSYGHLAGDDVLRSVAQTIKATAERPGDITARFGGEEFAVILPGASTKEAESFGNKLCRSIESLGIPHAGSTVAGVLTVSIGGASSSPRQGDTVLTLIAAADAALYHAKQRGRNGVVARELHHP